MAPTSSSSRRFSRTFIAPSSSPTLAPDSPGSNRAKSRRKAAFGTDSRNGAGPSDPGSESDVRRPGSSFEQVVVVDALGARPSERPGQFAQSISEPQVLRVVHRAGDDRHGVSDQGL